MISKWKAKKDPAKGCKNTTTHWNNLKKETMMYKCEAKKDQTKGNRLYC